ncbi:MAG: hypothetical protein QOI61_144 [Actinomycetota bacterium]|jgi:uncharacterized glyoxalase superfamily protein PhnB
MATTINPVLHYDDLDKAVAYLKDTFGFTEHVVHRDPTGNPMYAELELQGCFVGVGGKAEEGSPFDLGPTVVYVALDDPDAMHAVASKAGAEVVMPLVDQEYGSREFAARDYEGNVWCFGTYRAGPK